MNSIPQLLNELKKLVRNETATPAKLIDFDTLICFYELNVNGSKTYFQCLFNELPNNFQLAFKDKKVGDKIGNFKILAIYDVWEEKSA